jgi:hypothetical protein
LLGFLQPIWLLGIAGIVIPVMIHLWNNKQGKMLSIGSIDFLDKTSLRKARSRRISDWWLLLARCLLLVLLALLLAGPFWKRGPDPRVKGWVMLSGVKDRRLQAMKDSLLAAGFEEHPVRGHSWWAAFSILDKEAPAGIPFYVFTDGLLEHFYGNRPATGRPVYWYLDETRDSAVQWVQAAWKQGADSMGVLTGRSSATGTTYSYRTFLTNSTSAGTTPVDTTTLQVTIYADEKYKRDGDWVDAAVRALQQFTRRNIAVSRRPEDTRKKHISSPGLPADWVFWLSEKPLEIYAPNVVLYEPGHMSPVNTWIGGSTISVEKMTTPVPGLKPIWTDGYGRPLMALETTDRGRRYHFFSHFDPTWNGLVWSEDFPIRIKELLLDPPRENTGEDVQASMVQDRRVIDPAQVAPSRSDNGQNEIHPTSISVDVSPFVWLLVFLALVTERILSFKSSGNG